jgi:hypothetical protein
MMDPALAQRFVEMTGVECADQLRELNQPRGFRPIGETIEQILKRIGVQ